MRQRGEQQAMMAKKATWQLRAKNISPRHWRDGAVNAGAESESVVELPPELDYESLSWDSKHGAASVARAMTLMSYSPA